MMRKHCARREYIGGLSSTSFSISLETLPPRYGSRPMCSIPLLQISLP
jgi:hypothetical protein